MEKTVSNHLDLIARYRDELRHKPDLDQFFLELTLKCNEYCFHCGSGCSAELPDGLKVDIYKSLLDELRVSFGEELFIAITGGEPLIYKDFEEVVSYVNKLGFSWGMTSNATLITKDVACMLKRCGMYSISISIDGLRDTHDRYRRLPGSYDKTINGLVNLIEAGIPSIMITTVANHENIDQLDEMFEIFDGYDIDDWRITGIEPIGRAKEHPEMYLTREDHRRLLDFIKTKREEGYPLSYGCPHFLGEYEGMVRDWYFMCQAGTRVASVTAEGDFVACLNIPRNDLTIQGNIFKDKFTDVWRDRYEFFRTPLSNRCDRCKNCNYNTWCSGDSYHSWDYEKDEPVICANNL